MLAIVIMSLPIASTVFAMGGETFLTEYTYSGNEVYQQLREIGFTDKEMLDLFQKRS